MTEYRSKLPPLETLLGHFMTGLKGKVISSSLLQTFMELSRSLKSLPIYSFRVRYNLQNPDEADLSVYFPKRTGTWHVLAGDHPFSDLPESLMTTPGWAAARRLADHWTRVSYLGGWMVAGIRLQFRIRTGMKDLPQPFLFFNLPGRQTRKEINPWDYLPAMRDAFMVLGVKIGPDVESRMENCMRCFFENTRTFRLGVDLSNKNTDVRLSVCNGSWEEVLRETLQDDDSETKHALDLSLVKGLGEVKDTNISPILAFLEKSTHCPGFEIALSRGPADERQENRRIEADLLKACVLLGLMAPEQRLLIQNWPGAEKVFLDSNDWTEKGSVWGRKIDRLELFPNRDGEPHAFVELSCNRAL